MKHQNHRIPSGILLAMLMLTAVSCGAESTAQTTQAETGTNGQTETEAVTESVVAFLPEGLDYNGEDFRFLHAQNVYDDDTHTNEINYALEDVESGNIIDEAVYNRTRMTEETLNIKIVSNHISYDEAKNYISKSVMAQDNEFEAVCGRLFTGAELTLKGYTYNLRNIPTLNLDNPW